MDELQGYSRTQGLLLVTLVLWIESCCMLLSVTFKAMLSLT